METLACGSGGIEELRRSLPDENVPTYGMLRLTVGEGAFSRCVRASPVAVVARARALAAHYDYCSLAAHARTILRARRRRRLTCPPTRVSVRARRSQKTVLITYSPDSCAGIKKAKFQAKKADVKKTIGDVSGARTRTITPLRS